MAAENANAESSMEARIARIESDVAHLAVDVADIKIDIRGLRDKMDALDTKLSDKIDAVDTKLSSKIESVSKHADERADALDAKLSSKIEGVRDSLAKAKVWALLLYFALAGALLGTMARGFGWL